MTLANSSITVTDQASGPEHATHTVSSKEHPVVMIADDSGHLLTTKPTYTLWIPGVGASASRLHFDLFNGLTSGKIIEILGVWAIPKSDVAVTGAIAVPMGLFRTSTVGSSATATAGYNTGTTLTSPVITPLDTTNPSLPAAITARSIPTAGASISAPWWENYIFTEETNAATYLSAYTNLLPVIPGSQPWTLREGQGMVAKQGSTSSTVGTIAWLTLIKVF